MAKKQFTMDNRQKEKYAELITVALDTMERAKYQQPWVQPHHGSPMNYEHKKAYRGCNDFWLTLLCAVRGWRVPMFLTFEQMKELGLSLNVLTDKDGMAVLKDSGMPEFEKSFPVVKKITNVYRNGEKLTFDDYDALTQEEKDECRWYSALRIYPEFNLSQTNFAEKYPDKWEALQRAPEHGYEQGATDEVLDRIITQGEWRCPIEFGGWEACYIPAKDCIHLPERASFLGDERFYSTALHEMAHSTAPDVKREAKGTFGSEDYAMEEFVAELTAASVCSMLGIGKLLDENHIAYVQSWRRALKSDKDFIPKVIDQVQAATNYILRRYDDVRKSAKPALKMAA